MRIAFNPSTVAALTSPPNNKDITFDLRGQNIFARGVKFYGTDTWRPVVDNLTSNSATSSLSANQGRVLAGLINGKSDSDHNHDGRYIRKSGDTMLGALNFANGTWNLVGDDSYMGDCNISGHFGIKAANTTYPGIAFFNNASAFLGNLTAYSGNIKYGAYSLQFLDNGNTSVSSSTWTNPFSAYNSNAVADGQAICVWGQASQLSNLSTDTGDMSLWLKRVNAKAATLNMVLDGEYYANGNQRLAHISEIPTSLKNPHALTISLNGTSQGPYDGSAAKSINITPGSIGAATSGHNHDGRYVYNYGGTQMDGASRNKNALGMSTSSGITGDWWHILQAAWNDEYRWNSQIAFPTQNRNGMYYRSGLNDNTKWGSWVKLLDTNNYSGVLDSRYYTESEVNSLLDAKLNRQNLSYGIWNPRGYNLAADYSYNGGDLSISETGGQIHVSVDGKFWQNEGQYRVLDTSDITSIRGGLTLYQYLSSTDNNWFPLVWGGSDHTNTNNSTGSLYKSHAKLSWQTSSQTLYATNIRTENIKYLSIGGGIFWNPNVESATDGSDAASITLVKSGVAGGTTLVLSQMNDANDTIQFKTNTAARLYHNSYPILTTQNTYVSNNKGYINGAEITQVNNADKVDNRHAISTIPNTGIIYKAAIYTSSSLTSYWVRLASIPGINQHNEFVATIHVQSGHSNPGRSAILLVYLRGAASSLSKSFKICCNSNYDPNRFRLYYKDSDKTSEIWYQTTGQWDGIITTVISQSSEGSLYEGLTLYSGSITAVQTPSMSTYLSAQVSTITDNISGNASTATKLATPRKIWGQSFDGTADVDNTLRIRKTTGNYCEGIRIQTGDGAWSTIILGATADSGTNANAWSIHRKSDNNFAISRNSSDGTNGLVMTPTGMGLGTTAPTQRLDVVGNIRATGQIIRGGSSQIWVNGRNGALLRETSVAGYHALWSLKTTDGSWDFGEYNAGRDWNNIPVLSYITDSNYNSGNNVLTYQIKFPLASGTVALTSQASSFDVNTAQYLRSLGNQNCQTGRTQAYGDVYTYNTYNGNTGSPTTYTSVIGFGRGIGGTVEIAGGWTNTHLYWRSLRDCCEDWHSWRTVLDSNNYTDFIGSYYWANVKISTSSSTTTSPTVSNLTATNSIKMGNILLEYADEINNITNDGSLNLNCRNSGDVSLCAGGGKVGIGTRYPTHELYVMGYTRTEGFGINPYYLSDSELLPTISPGDGYTYRCLEIGRPTKISCIIADKTYLPGSMRGVLLNFKEGFDGQLVLLKDLQNYGSGNGYFWVMPSRCKIIRADGSSILIGQNQISNTYDDCHSRFFIYSSKYSAWIEFLCS